MILISHRGNINGKIDLLENLPEYVLKASEKYDVEIDVWFKDNNFFLGHDGPDHEVDSSFLKNPKFWCHAKNIAALKELLKLNVHCFWHQNDDVTLTSNNFIWTYPGKKIIDHNSIAVMPELYQNWDITKCIGICSDYISNYE